MSLEGLTPTAAAKIQYVVVHPNDGASEFSAFQGYGPGLLSTLWAFERIATLPLDVFDFGRDWDEVLTSRIKGDGCCVLPLQLSALPVLLNLGFPFVCLCSHPEISDDVDALVTQAGRPIHHVRLPNMGGLPQPVSNEHEVVGPDPALELAEQVAGFDSSLTYQALFNYSMRVLDFLDGLGGTMRDMGIQVRTQLGNPRPLRATPAFQGPPRRSHFVTDPTEAVLEATGFSFTGSERPPFGPVDNYARAIADAARPLIQRRQELLGASSMLRFLAPNDLIVAVPSLQARWYERRARRFRPIKGMTDAKRTVTLVRAVADAIAKQTGYLLHLPAKLSKGLKENPSGTALMHYRREEVRAFTAQLSLRASADGVPVLRLPAGVNLTRVSAGRLATATRQRIDANRLRKVNRFARDLSQALSAATPAELKEIIASAGPRLKIVADAPLEWMQVGATPLMLRADCSRIPATTGNSSFSMTVGGFERIIPLASLDEVLIVRSFSTGDPIRNVLVGTVESFLRKSEAKVRIRVVDVKSLEEFAMALESFSGALLIFDGHGRAGSSTTAGTLQIDGRDVDVWSLRGQVNVPPIVVLSACDAHAFDGSHGTPAHAFLAAGAETVLGTTLPVDALYSAMFVARLLFRLDSYLPHILSGPHGVARWSEILPGLQKMNYATEMLYVINGKNGIRLSADDHMRAAFVANTHINKSLGPMPETPADTPLPPRLADLFAQTMQEEHERIAQLEEESLRGGEVRYPTWLAATFDRVSKDCGASRRVIEGTVEEWAWLTDALKYVQLGNPDRLLVVRGSVDTTSS